MRVWTVAHTSTTALTKLKVQESMYVEACGGCVQCPLESHYQTVNTYAIQIACRLLYLNLVGFIFCTSSSEKRGFYRFVSKWLNFELYLINILPTFRLKVQNITSIPRKTCVQNKVYITKCYNDSFCGDHPQNHNRLRCLSWNWWFYGWNEYHHRRCQQLEHRHNNEWHAKEPFQWGIRLNTLQIFARYNWSGVPICAFGDFHQIGSLSFSF